MSIIQSLHPPKSRVLDKFFKSFPRYHFLKFLLNHKLHRLVTFFIFKLGYYAWFRVKNRVQLVNTNNILPKQSYYKGEPFLIVENHNMEIDVICHYCCWAHLGYMTYVFTTEGSFDITYPIVPILTHFAEMIPRWRSGESSVQRMVDRLMQGDIVNIFPEGTYPSGKYANKGFVQEGFTGAVRVAYNYWKRTGKDLWIQPVASLGGNLAYPPKRRWMVNVKVLRAGKIIIKYGKPFVLKFSKEPDHAEFNNRTHDLMMHIASELGQKKLVPNYTKLSFQENSGAGKPRKYDIFHHKHGMGRKRHHHHKK
jgi:1-acyl-sn-glycerol-3-phosphate acyltransferase